MKTPVVTAHTKLQARVGAARVDAAGEVQGDAVPEAAARRHKRAQAARSGVRLDLREEQGRTIPVVWHCFVLEFAQFHGTSHSLITRCREY